MDDTAGGGGRSSARDELDLLRRVDPICERFEVAWRAGESPRIEDYLVGWDGVERRALFRHLLAIELDLRRSSGERLDVAQVRDRFAEFGDLTELGADPEETVGGRHARAAGVPDRIGPYEIRGKLGEGGFGTVYRGEQLRPLRRHVAIKILRPELGSDDVLRRFEAERQALAVMDHVHIAQALDAGTTEDGRSYFVMEFVDGSPITIHCEERRLSTRDRLMLFLAVCRGVQHAHLKGVVHRDLKPSNILVTTQDGVAVPKIIDFGVAKATQGKLTELTIVTQQGLMIGTPAYMSPEQAEGDLDVDSRADVYALGAILYELLTGVRPLDNEALLRHGHLGIPRAIREHEPSRPSSRILSASKEFTDGDGDSTGAGVRRREVSGDLDWIVLKALEKDRARRYDTPSAFAADIDRFLNHEPVLASPPSTGYRMRKFVRRNRAIVFGLGATLLATSIGLVVSLGYFFRERSARAAAEEAKTVSGEVTSFLASMIESPSDVASVEITLRDAIDRGARTLDPKHYLATSLARIHTILGSAYVSLDVADSAMQHLSQVDLEGLDDPNLVVDALLSMAQAHRRREDLDQARASLVELERRLDDPEFRVDDPLGTRSMIANEYGGLGDIDRARSIVADVLRQAEQLEGERRLRVEGNAHLSLASTLSPFDTDATLVHAKAAWERIDQTALRDTRRGAMALSLLAGMLTEIGDPAALEYGASSVELARRLYGRDHALTAASLEGYGGMLVQIAMDVPAAEAAFQEALDIWRRIREPPNRDLALGLNNLAFVYLSSDRHAEALPLLEESIANLEPLSGVLNRRGLAGSLSNLGLVLRALGEHDRSREVYRRSLALFAETGETDSPRYAAELYHAALLEIDAGDLDRAIELGREAVRSVRAAVPAGDRRLGGTAKWLAGVLEQRGRPEDLAEATELRGERGKVDG